MSEEYTTNQTKRTNYIDMVMLENEEELVKLIDQKRDLLKKVVNDQISIDTFYEEYNWFYGAYVLDGHESDEEERELLLKYNNDIELFRRVEEEIFNRICGDEDSKRQNYIQQGRISAKKAIEELKSRKKELGL